MRVLSTEKLSELDEFIREYAYKNNGDMPTLTEITERTGMSKATAYRYLVRLRETGRIEYSGKGTLNIKDGFAKKCLSVRVPIYGSVICGSPEEEEQHGEGYLAIPEEWIDGECFLLSARGDSMIDAGVEEGDLVLVKKSDCAREGQIIVALTEDGNTLKRLAHDGERPVLKAENATYPAEKRFICPKRLEIQGVALKVIKSIG